MEKNSVVCTVCPNGCEIVVTSKGDEIVEVVGHKCKRGIEFAKNEILNPKRVLTSTVKIEGANIEMVPVKTKEPIKKELLFKAMGELAKIKMNAPVNTGDVVIENLLDTGVSVITTRSIKKID